MKKNTEKLYRKVALKIEMSKIEEKKKRAAQKPANEPKQPEEAEKEPEIKIEIKGNDIYQYLGKPKFLSDRFYEKTPPGVVMGLGFLVFFTQNQPNFSQFNIFY